MHSRSPLTVDRLRLFRFLPYHQRFFLGELLLQFLVLLAGKDQGADLAVDEFFGLFCQFRKVGFVDLPDEDEVDEAGVDALCVVACDEGKLHVPQARDDLFDKSVEAHGLGDDTLDLGEEGVLLVGVVEDCAAIGFGLEDAGPGEAVEFHPHGVGGLAEFVGQPPQVCGGVGVDEEFEEQFDACL